MMYIGKMSVGKISRGQYVQQAKRLVSKISGGQMSSRPFWYFVWKALCNRQIDMAPFFYGFVSATCNTIKIKKSQSLPYIYLSQKAAPHVREKVYIDKIPQFWCLDSGSISSNKALTKFERSSRKKSRSYNHYIKSNHYFQSREGSNNYSDQLLRFTFFIFFAEILTK